MNYIDNKQVIPNKACDEIKVQKKCPQCGHRLFDKISCCTGQIEIKCPKCGHICSVNLAFRVA